MKQTAETPSPPRDHLDELCDALLSLQTRDEARRFLRDLCTLQEIDSLGQRLAAAALIDSGMPYRDVARSIGASTATVTRVAHWLRHGEGGYECVLSRRRAA